MARAKRTDRAEARRRHRADLAAEAAAVAAESEADEGDVETEATPARAKPAPRPPQGPAVDSSGRLVPIQSAPQSGLFGAMRAAYQPWRPIDDLKLIRPLITRTHAVWVPALLAIIAGGAMVTRAAAYNPWLYALAGFILISPASPAMAGPFIAGVLTPRAGWLAGLIAALSAYLVGLLLIATGNLLVYDGSLGGVVPASPSDTATYASYSLTLVPFSAFVGAFAAWYKRFLALSSPRRQQQKAAVKNARSGSRSRTTARPGAASRRPR